MKFTTTVLVIVVVAVFSISTRASAETLCTIEPFTTKISQGDSANLSVLLTLNDPSVPFELSLGEMPNNTEGGLSQTSAVEQGSTVKKIPLSITAKSNAQTGSFMITVIAKSALAVTTYQTSCQFNLEIGERAVTASSITQNNAPTNTFQSVGAGMLPKDIATSSTIFLHTNPVSTQTVSSLGQTNTTSNKITANMQRGSRGAQVLFLQQMLQKLKFFPASEAPTGYFGSITEDAVKVFQASRYIEPIGIVGPLTRRALNESSL